MPSKKKMSLVSPIYLILVKGGLDQFTVRELRDAYLRCLELPATKDTKREAYHTVYRHMQTLLRNDFVEKTNGDDGTTRYQKTLKFHETPFVEKSSPKLEKVKGMTSTVVATAEVPSIANCALIATLQHMAYQYQVDLLAAIGESEEYQRLAKEHPTIKHLFDTDQRVAREKSSKLLGQLKAIETVIMQHAQQAG